MIAVSELRKWLSTFSNEDNELVIGEGGLTLELAHAPEVYIEVGGQPE